jgi:Flp pilus assembly pilin Flp
MNRIIDLIRGLSVLSDTQGQDLVEYALLGGFVAVAAGALIPDVSTSMSTIYSRVASRLIEAAG